MLRPLPPYAFVPTYWPHPVRDPRGHSHQQPQTFGPPPTEQDFQQHEGWAYVLLLLRSGYYWEAHEGLEHWWKQLPVTDGRRPFFQGLLHLAAAGVKARQGQPAGVHSHASKAEARLEEAQALSQTPAQSAEKEALLLGLSLRGLRLEASRVALQAAQFHTSTGHLPVLPVLSLQLERLR